MFEQSASTYSHCSSDDQLYQACLDACIEGIASFPVNKRRNSKGTCNFCHLPQPKAYCKHLVDDYFTTTSLTKRVGTLFTLVEPSVPLLSPPLLLQPQLCSSPSALPPSIAAAMNRSLLHGGPPRGNAGPPRGHQDARSSQDARSNLAVQPAANAGLFKLKKNAVKIVSAAGPAPSAPLPRAPPQAPASALTPAVASLLTSVSSPAPSPVRAQPQSVKEYVYTYVSAFDHCFFERD